MVRQKSNINIALSLSGGGYRAAAFHLGVLSYLNKVDLLEHVTILSTVSGGTLTGLSYAHSLVEKKSFEEFYQKFFKFLKEVNLIKLTLNNIGSTAVTKLGYKNAITTIADIYNKELFERKLFGQFWENTEIHVKDLIVNSTEFRTGVDFRFQKSSRTKAKIGNGNVEISVEDAKKIRLADIAAASSCFPGGFEPLAFPQDFQWPNNEIPPELLRKFPNPLPLMDGGIYDNQGIEAAVLAMKGKLKEIKMFIISDTDRKSSDLYPYPSDKKHSTISLSTMYIIGFCLFLLSATSFIVLIISWVTQYYDGGGWLSGFIRFGFPAIVLGTLASSMYWLREKVKDELFSRIPSVKITPWEEIKKLTIDQLLDMVELRATSVLALTSSVFMKRIRGLIYGIVFGDSQYKRKRISNLIYELNGHKPTRDSWLQPSLKIQEVTTIASNISTSVWFEKSSDQNTLIACGQYTICYNVLDFIIRLYGNNSNKYPSWAKKLFVQAKNDWDKFQQDPYVYVTFP